MAFEFPANPSVGDTYSMFTWNGYGWIRASSGDTDLELRVSNLETQATSLTNFSAPTGADGEPADYNIVIVDKSNGSVKTIPAPDFIEVE